MTFSGMPYENGAHARTTGNPCRKYAIDNGCCKLHEGKTPIRHGLRAKRAIEEQKLISQLICEKKALTKEVLK